MKQRTTTAASDAAADATDSNKKAKKDVENEHRHLEDILDTIWEHFGNFLGVNDEDEIDEADVERGHYNSGGEIDELLEIVDLLEDVDLLPMRLQDIFPVSSSSTSKVFQNLTRIKLLPIFLSVVLTMLADESIASLAHTAATTTTSTDSNGNSKSSNENDATTKLLADIANHLHKALTLFPDNAAAISTAANFVRMTTTTTASTSKGESASSSSSTSATATTTTMASLSLLSRWYILAADTAATVQAATMAVLSDEGGGNDGNENDAEGDSGAAAAATVAMILAGRNNNSGNSNAQNATVETIQQRILDDKNELQCREWIEALLLNQVCGVDLIPAPPDDDDDDDDNDDNEDDDAVESTPSTVEGTARFMAAMLSSMAGSFNVAKEQLQRPFGITHCIHPNVWSFQSQKRTQSLTGDAQSSQALAAAAFAPVSYNSVLPESLYERLCQVFAPHAPFWTESDYASRGYFSFYNAVPDELISLVPSTTPATTSNLLHDVIINHLLPLAQQQLAKSTAAKNATPASTTPTPIVGYEWWVHTRSVAANLGHNLHFDTDEALLQHTGQVRHPVISSVLYLTGGNDAGSQSSDVGGGGGATVVFDQAPDSRSNAESAWCSLPVDNALMMFPGNLLHGVLPCLGRRHADDDTVANGAADHESLVTKLRACLQGDSKDDSMVEQRQVTDSTRHRLTLMVGFWTRSVPDELLDETEQKVSLELYGPCSPLPLAKDTAWVRELEQGYENKPNKTSDQTKVDSVGPLPVPRVTPAWDEWDDANDGGTSNNEAYGELEIPPAIDHKFFVVNAPECFAESLERPVPLPDDDQDEEDDEEDDDNEE